MTSTHDRTPRPRLSYAQLKADMRGNWAAALEELAPELADAVANAPEHVACPIHGGRDGFRLYSNVHETGGGVCNTCGSFPTGFELIAWARGIAGKDAVREVGQWFRKGSPSTRAAQAPAPALKAVDYEGNARRIRWARETSLPLKGTPAESYLWNRGIWRRNMPATLRYHPGMRYYHRGEDFGQQACLLAPVTDELGRILTMHRVFVTADGQKADLPEVKKMMGRAADLNGAAIKLFSAEGDVLGVAEGIETALAAHAISKMPVWATVAAQLMESIVIPPSVRKVVIWVDLDAGGRGLKAAIVLAYRLLLAKVEVELLLPPGEIPVVVSLSRDEAEYPNRFAEAIAQRFRDEGRTVVVLSPGDQAPAPLPGLPKGIDWLDVLIEKGEQGFPAHWNNWRASERPRRT